MARVDYMEVGKEVLIAGIGGTAVGLVHFMFLEPQLAGQQIMGVNTATIVDVILAFVVGVATKMYARGASMKILGYGASAVLVTVALLRQFGIIAGPAPAPTPTVGPIAVGQGPIPRASVLAPSGVVVNKHGTVPEMAPGTFG